MTQQVEVGHDRLEPGRGLAAPQRGQCIAAGVSEHRAPQRRRATALPPVDLREKRPPWSTSLAAPLSCTRRATINHGDESRRLKVPAVDRRLSARRHEAEVGEQPREAAPVRRDAMRTAAPAPQRAEYSRARALEPLAAHQRRADARQLLELARRLWWQRGRLRRGVHLTRSGKVQGRFREGSGKVQGRFDAACT